ncbi:MAG: phosphoribosyl-AMP cyclohydrolase [Acidilobaceae archaeon]
MTEPLEINQLLDLIDFEKAGGIVPVVVQDYRTKDVLMLAYANREAIERTVATGLAHFWSRSRKRLWLKGETSGNIMKVVEIRIDCDNDAILYLVEATGPACHTGNKTCFFRGLRIRSQR